jgi:type IV secretory pathway VirB2 component (pilin)
VLLRKVIGREPQSEPKQSSEVSRSLLEGVMSGFAQIHTSPRKSIVRIRFTKSKLPLVALLVLVPTAALAQGSPFDNGFTALQTLFTGTVAKVASLIAIVIGGYQFAHGEPGGKKALAGVAAGTGIAVLAANVLTWLWGV